MLGLGQLVAVSAMGIVIPLIPFFLRELGMTDRAQLERWSGLVFSAPFLAAAVMSPVWGYLGDRYGHKKMVVRAIVGLAVVNLLLVFVRSPSGAGLELHRDASRVTAEDAARIAAELRVLLTERAEAGTRPSVLRK